VSLVNYATREITCKIVYYGPGRSGKTTNLHYIYGQVPDDRKGKMVSLATQTDRTLFFDFLPLDLGQISGFTTKFQLYTVPGQVYYQTTRKLVLQGADGVVFVADSQRSEAKANNEAWKSMMENFKENGLDPEVTPIAIQFNKRDMPDIRTDAELDQLKQNSREPVFKAVAIRGTGVLETLFALLKLTYRSLNTRHDFEGKFGLSEAEFLRAIFKRVNLDAAGVKLGEELA